MPDIFLSYAGEDRDRVKPLAEALLAKGHQVWWDRGLAAGDDYARVIGAALEQSKVVIVVWTAASAASVWVRDEAARARDAGKLLPILLEQTTIPLGFGAIQAEDFTHWNGAANAAQMQLLDDVVQARLAGRAVDAEAVAGRRTRLMRRVRVASILTGVATVIAIIAGLSVIAINHRAATRPPVTASVSIGEQLLQMVRDGTITAEQAVELARVLENGAFAGTQAAAATGPQPPSLDLAMASAASVDGTEFSALARGLYRDNIDTLLRSSDPAVRQAAVDLSEPAKRDQAVEALWTVAEAGGPDALPLWLVLGSVGLAAESPRGVQALERARAIQPDNYVVWRLLGFGYATTERPVEAQGAALVGAGLAAQEAQAPEVATQHLEEALPSLEDPLSRTFVQSTLGDVAVEQGDLRVAADRFREALSNDDPAAAELSPEANEINEAATLDLRSSVRQRYAATLEGTGRGREACLQLRAVAREGGVLREAAPALLERCQIPVPPPLTEATPAPAETGEAATVPATQVPASRSEP